MNYKQLFIDFWTEMQSDPMISSLANTIEASPWHREDNVLVHTTMVVNQFLGRWVDSSDKTMYLAALAAMFHDVGKPAAEEVRESPERGVYRRYAGHEHLSATTWLDFVLKTKQVADRLSLSADDIYLVAWMIEYHLPYDVKDKTKRQGLYATPASYDAVEAFVTLLRSDAYGRISDDHDAKMAKVEAWIADYLKLDKELGELPDPSRKSAVILIGSSSSGKSTKRAQLIEEAESRGETVEIFSMDDVRLACFPSDGTPVEQYSYAFEQSIGQDGAIFTAAVEARLNQVFATGADWVISDNTNSSKKARNGFIARARQKGYQIVAVVMLTHPHEALARQRGRVDREGVPIWSQFKALTVPTLGSEVDHVIPVLAWTE